MPASDLVPCFYTGQNYRAEEAAKAITRAEAHEYKRQKLGRFVENGKIFLFSQKVIQAVGNCFDVPATAKTLLTLIKTRCDGSRLHYEMPMAGDRSIWARHHRPLIHVSGRSVFSHQVLPARVSA